MSINDQTHRSINGGFNGDEEWNNTSPDHIHNDISLAYDKSPIATYDVVDATDQPCGERLSPPWLCCPVCQNEYQKDRNIFQCTRCCRPFCEECKWIIDECGQCGENIRDMVTCRDNVREKAVRKNASPNVEWDLLYQIDD